MSLRQPEAELERGIVERQRELVPDPVDRGLLEMDDELADVDTSQTGTEQACEQGHGERDEGDDLPPEQVLVGKRAVDEREDALEDGPQRDRDRREQERREDPPRPRRGAHEPTDDERDEERGQHAVEHDHERLLERLREPVGARHLKHALARSRKLAERPRRVRDEEHRQRERQHGGVADLDERTLVPVGDPPGRIGEHGVAHERVADVAEREEDGEEDRVVAVPQLTHEEREAGRDHQRPDAVPGSARPGDEAGEEERPPDADDRQRARGRRVRAEAVDLHPVGDDPEGDPRYAETDLRSPRH